MIELLVVIAIIAVLMGILLPSLNKARDQARRVHCISNVKTLSLGWFMYKDENDDRLVGGSTGVIGGQMQWVGDPPSDDANLDEKKEAIKEGVLFPYMGGEVDVYHCPADRRKSDTAAFRTFSIAGGANGQTTSEYTAAKIYSDLKRPATRYVFIAEMDTRGWNKQSWLMQPKSQSWIDPMAMWHDRRTTLGFADGHAEMHLWKDQGLIDWANKAMFNPNSFSFDMTPSADEHEDVGYMAKRYPYKKLN